MQIPKAGWLLGVEVCGVIGGGAGRLDYFCAGSESPPATLSPLSSPFSPLVCPSLAPSPLPPHYPFFQSFLHPIPSSLILSSLYPHPLPVPIPFSLFLDPLYPNPSLLLFLNPLQVSTLTLILASPGLPQIFIVSSNHF